MGTDRERSDRIRKELVQSPFDALFCRIPENVLYLTNYWPVIGASAVLWPSEGEPTLIAPEDEADYLGRSWVKDIRSYKFIDLNAVADPNRGIFDILREVLTEKGLERAKIGYEGSFDLVAANHVGGEVRVPEAKAFGALLAAAPDAELEDATSLIKQLRVVKTMQEIAILKICNEIAGIGLAAAREAIEEGAKESEVAAAIEAKIYAEGVGHRGVERARGFAFVMSGPLSANSWRPFCISTNRKLRRGDPVLVELDTYADGYWSDLTRTFVVGAPDKKQREIFEIVLEAEQAAVDSIWEGCRASSVDAAARALIEKRGYGKYFCHQLGHGVGLAFHEPPTLHPASEDVLLPGMTHAVEPGIYIPDWGGIRNEDNVVDKKKGAEYLSTFEREL